MQNQKPHPDDTTAFVQPTPASQLSFDDLALFARVVALGTLSAVARERLVPTSQVSRTLTKIEQSYGVALMHRSTHGLSLTPEGEAFLGYCNQVLATLGELEGEFDEKSQRVIGMVRMSASPVVAQTLIVPHLPRLLALHPGLQIDLSVDDRMVDLVRDGVDIGIRTGTPASDAVIARRVALHKRGLFAAPSYLATHGTPATPDDLKRHALITNASVHALNRWRFLIDGKLQEITMSGTHRVDSTATLMNMAVHGMGITRLNHSVAAELLAGGKLVEVLAAFADPTPLPVYVVFLPERQRLPKIRTCVEFWSAVIAKTSTEKE
jgi:DNA-binding transcriptional LysR family regulator